MVIVPVRLPAAVGVKITWNEQEALAFKLVPQLLLPEAMTKSGALGLPTLSPVRVDAVVFVTVTVCAAAAVPIGSIVNANAEGESFTAGAAATFWPLRLTVWVPALSVKVIVPVSVPVAPVGTKLTVSVQPAFGSIVVTHGLLTSV
jgi:hypothetical protein